MNKIRVEYLSYAKDYLKYLESLDSLYMLGITVYWSHKTDSLFKFDKKLEFEVRENQLLENVLLNHKDNLAHPYMNTESLLIYLGDSINIEKLDEVIKTFINPIRDSKLTINSTAFYIDAIISKRTNIQECKKNNLNPPEEILYMVNGFYDKQGCVVDGKECLRIDHDPTDAIAAVTGSDNLPSPIIEFCKTL